MTSYKIRTGLLAICFLAINGPNAYADNICDLSEDARLVDVAMKQYSEAVRKNVRWDHDRYFFSRCFKAEFDSKTTGTSVVLKNFIGDSVPVEESAYQVATRRAFMPVGFDKVIEFEYAGAVASAKAKVLKSFQDLLKVHDEVKVFYTHVPSYAASECWKFIILLQPKGSSDAISLENTVCS